ncbi:S-layer homology domain-containing protein, partial [Paenibacillus paridis]|uniref:S-layer homology domain-containing protein n=1 Tax=Paenibacillus paridis TaxID=2583376 RepID=UPI001123DB5F
AAYTFTPTTAGQVTLVFTANDGNIDSTDTYTVELTVNSIPVRKPNVGATTNATVTVNTPYTLDLSTIFEDADSNTLSYKVSVDGEAATTAAAAYTFTPTTAGQVTLVFTANDGNIDSTDTYTVVLTVNSMPVRKPNVGATTNATVTVNTPYTLDLSTIFEDADGDLLSYKVAVDGNPAIAANETYSYTPTSEGIVTLVFAVHDGKVVATDTYTVTLTVSRPEAGGTGGPANPSYHVTISGTNSTLPVKIDAKTGRAVIAVGALAEKLFVSGEPTEITVPIIPNVDHYTLEVPADTLSGSQGTGTLIFITPKGSITIPADMLKGMVETEGKIAGITIGLGDKTGLSAEAKAAIGNRPFVELTLTLDGVQTPWNNPAAAVKLSIPYVPTAEELEDPEHIVIWYVDGSGNIIAVPSGRYNAKSGTVTFATTHFSDYAVAYVKKAFSDLSSVEWARQSIEVLASKGIINGTVAGAYSPSARITRADYLVLLVKTLGLTAEFEGNFADVKPDAYYYETLGVAKRLGLATGIGNDEFHPLENISRQDMMVLTARALEKAKQLKASGDLAILASFNDKGDIAEYAKASLAALVEEGLISGSGNKLNPQAPTTRAEAAVFLYRIYNQY